MSIFSSAALAAIETIFATFGDTAIFTPVVGADVSVTVIVDTSSDWQPGGQVRVADPRTVIRYLRADINRKVKRGETFSVNGTVYTVVSMSQYPDAWTEFEGKAVVRS